MKREITIVVDIEIETFGLSMSKKAMVIDK